MRGGQGRPGPVNTRPPPSGSARKRRYMLAWLRRRRTRLLLDPVPRFRVDDRRMKAVVDLPFVPQPSEIDRVREDPIEVTPRHQSASGSSACLARPNRRAKVLGVENYLEAHHAADFEIAAKEGADELGLLFDNVEGAIFDPVAERNRSAHPDALPFRRGDLVADSLARDLALELGEGQEHVEGEPPHAARRVEGLGHRDEGDAVRPLTDASPGSAPLRRTTSFRVTRAVPTIRETFRRSAIRAMR